MDADVLVIGSGTMGSFTLWRLASRGVRALGIERFQPGHDRGAGHGESRMLRSAYYEGSEYVPLVRRSIELWRELEVESGTALLTMTGALMIGEPASELVAGTLASARAYGLPHRLLDATEATREHPEQLLRPEDVMVWEEQAGILRPETAIKTAAGRARALGAGLITGQQVRSLAAGPAGVEVVVDGEVHRAGHAVVAAGPWTLGLLPQLGLPLSVDRQVMLWFRPRDPAALAPERFGAFMREDDQAIWYGLAPAGSDAVKVSVHGDGRPTDPDAVDREIHEADIEPVARRVAEYLPALDPVPVRAATCMYTNTPDRHFVIGAAPGLPHVTILAGFSGHGFKFAPVVGEIAADLATGEGTSLTIDRFSPLRFDRME